MALYKNVKTGVVISTPCVIYGDGTWEKYEPKPKKNNSKGK